VILCYNCGMHVEYIAVSSLLLLLETCLIGLVVVQLATSVTDRQTDRRRGLGIRDTQ